jgi:hypothetical protein
MLMQVWACISQILSKLQYNFWGKDQTHIIVSYRYVILIESKSKKW